MDIKTLKDLGYKRTKFGWIKKDKLATTVYTTNHKLSLEKQKAKQKKAKKRKQRNRKQRKKEILKRFKRGS
jgi:hypothetical protein